MERQRRTKTPQATVTTESTADAGLPAAVLNHADRRSLVGQLAAVEARLAPYADAHTAQSDRADKDDAAIEDERIGIPGVRPTSEARKRLRAMEAQHEQDLEDIRVLPKRIENLTARLVADLRQIEEVGKPAVNRVNGRVEQLAAAAAELLPAENESGADMQVVESVVRDVARSWSWTPKLVYAAVDVGEVFAALRGFLNAVQAARAAFAAAEARAAGVVTESDRLKQRAEDDRMYVAKLREALPGFLATAQGKKAWGLVERFAAEFAAPGSPENVAALMERKAKVLSSFWHCVADFAQIEFKSEVLENVEP